MDKFLTPDPINWRVRVLDCVHGFFLHAGEAREYAKACLRAHGGVWASQDVFVEHWAQGKWMHNCHPS